MKQKSKIAILGGGGRTGKFVVTKLVNHGYHLKLLLRHPENFNTKNPFIEIMKGDATDPEAVDSLVEACQAVISTVGQRKDEPLVACKATVNVLSAMKKYKSQRYILVAGLNLDTPFDKKGPSTIGASEWMKANFPQIHEDRQKTYYLLSESDVNWTVVRVPLIEFSDVENEIKVSLEDCVGNKISAADIANFLTEQLSDTRYFKKAPFISNG